MSDKCDPEGCALHIDAFRARAEQAEARLAEYEKVLGPFADVAENDIGADEKNADFFRPMNPRYARAPALTVGDLRRAAAAIRKGET